MCCLEEYEKIIQTFTPLPRKSLIDNMEPNRFVRLHKFNGLICRRQAYQCTVTYIITKNYFLPSMSPPKLVKLIIIAITPNIKLNTKNITLK